METEATDPVTATKGREDSQSVPGQVKILETRKVVEESEEEEDGAKVTVRENV